MSNIFCCVSKEFISPFYPILMARQNHHRNGVKFHYFRDTKSMTTINKQ